MDEEVFQYLKVLVPKWFGHFVCGDGAGGRIDSQEEGDMRRSELSILDQVRYDRIVVIAIVVIDDIQG